MVSIIALLVLTYRDPNQTTALTVPTRKHPKTVRLNLLPSPPPEVELNMPMQDDQLQPHRSETTDVVFSQRTIVSPTDSVDEKPQLRSGSKWRQHDLELLKVKFDPDDDSELSVLDVGHEWNENQRESTIPKRLPSQISKCL